MKKIFYLMFFRKAPDLLSLKGCYFDVNLSKIRYLNKKYMEKFGGFKKTYYLCKRKSGMS
jgi:hypothetical protein